jgi:hypothetical protein
MHQLTAIGRPFDPRKFDEVFARTNDLRTVAVDNMLAAARITGAKAFLAQRFCGWPFERRGRWVKTENDPLDPAPPGGMARSHAAIVYLETAVLKSGLASAIVLRYRNLYGPETSYAEGGETFESVRQGKFPIIGKGTGH